MNVQNIIKVTPSLVPRLHPLTRRNVSHREARAGWARDKVTPTLLRDKIHGLRARGCGLRDYQAQCIYNYISCAVSHNFSVFSLFRRPDCFMIADEHNAEEVGAERMIDGRKIPLGTWLLEKLGLCNCCPKARCAFKFISWLKRIPARAVFQTTIHCHGTSFGSGNCMSGIQWTSDLIGRQGKLEHCS